MKYIKEFNDYDEINENFKSTLIKACLITSLFLKSADVKPSNVNTHNVDKIEQISKNVKDEQLAKILSEIQSNLHSKDSAKYIELFNKLSSHIEINYDYKIKEQNIDELDENDIKGMDIFMIMGWLGSICLAVCGLPQAWMSYKDKHSDGISWAFLLLWSFGEIFALAYVYDNLDLPLVLNYGVNILIVAVILYYKVKPSNQISEKIVLPVEVGDTIYMGRFKNKKTVIKDIGKDDNGMPTINGKKVVNFRINKTKRKKKVNEGLLDFFKKKKLVHGDDNVFKQEIEDSLLSIIDQYSDILSLDIYKIYYDDDKKSDRPKVEVLMSTEDSDSDSDRAPQSLTFQHYLDVKKGKIYYGFYITFHKHESGESVDDEGDEYLIYDRFSKEKYSNIINEIKQCENNINNNFKIVKKIDHMGDKWNSDYFIKTLKSFYLLEPKTNELKN